VTPLLMDPLRYRQSDTRIVDICCPWWFFQHHYQIWCQAHTTNSSDGIIVRNPGEWDSFTPIALIEQCFAHSFCDLKNSHVLRFWFCLCAAFLLSLQKLCVINFSSYLQLFTKVLETPTTNQPHGPVIFWELRSVRSSFGKIENFIAWTVKYYLSGRSDRLIETT
jgi:hypothetical protein